MKVIVNKAVLSGTVKAISSKSHAHRILIGAALSDIATVVTCEETSDDIMATINCLKGMGAKITDIANGYKVEPIDRDNLLEEIAINCNESGSTLRFILPIVSALFNKTSIDMRGRLSKRPIEPLRSELIKHGATIGEEGSVPLRVNGKITSGNYVIPGNISSQYISGLLFALPLLDGDSTITITDEIESRSYIDLTIDVIRMFEINIEWEGNVIKIPGNQEYKSPSEITVEGDWSNMAFWLAAGALNNEEMSCGNLNFYSVQGDKHILEILKEMGTNIIYDSNNSLILQYSGLEGITIDVKNIPDLVPVIAVLASVAKGKTTIVNAKRLRMKESDRIESVVNTLKALGADIEATEDGMVINGVESLKGGEVDSCNDHRIVMMAAVAALVSEESVVITNAEAVNKSYRTFFEDYKKLGGIVKYSD